MALPLLIPIAAALAKVGGAVAAKAAAAGAAAKGLGAAAGKFLASEGAKNLGGQLATNAGSQLVSNGIGAMFGGGGGQAAPQAEQTPINIPQMALQNKMAEMKANTQPMQAQAVQPVQTNNNQDMLKQGLMDRLRFRRTGGIY